MADFTYRHPLNVPGKFYVDDTCTDCDFCREVAPNNVRRNSDTAHSYVFKQPENEAEFREIMEGLEGCPTESVGQDGDRFDWQEIATKYTGWSNRP